ncbi:MAG: hypothetical protein H6581_30380 [Bacteroidia bacterium]|nr:hypothetical protein [Bacteroidia bacterium]
MKYFSSKLSIFALILLAGFFTLTSQGCGKKGCMDPDSLNYDPDATKDDGSCEFNPEIMAHFHSHFGADALTYNQNYTLSSGRKVNLSLAQFYVSGMKLTDGGSGYSFDDTYLLVKGDQTVYELGSADPGQYTGFTFDVGVDSAANHSDPSTYETSSALSPQSPSMHWSWSSGYIFIKIEGMADTSAAGNGAVDYPFELHVGMDAMLRNVSLSQALDATLNNEVEIGMVIDWSQFFNGIDMTTPFTTHTMDNMPVAMKVADNVSSAITLE